MEVQRAWCKTDSIQKIVLLTGGMCMETVPDDFRSYRVFSGAGITHCLITNDIRDSDIWVRFPLFVSTAGGMHMP